MPVINRCYLEIVGTGSPVVFLHGYPLNRSMWQEQISAIGDQHRVILVDLPGFGDAPPATADEIFTVSQIADEVVKSLHDCGIDQNAIFVGLSMGGYVAFEIWKRHRQWVKGLVLTNTKALADTPSAAEHRKKVAALALEQGTQAAVAPMFEKLLASSSQQSNLLTEWLQQTMASVHPNSIAMAMHAMAARDDFTSQLSHIEVPTLVIAGRDDSIVPVDVMQAMAQGIPNATFHVVENSAHLTPIEQPGVFNQLLLDYVKTV